MEFSSEELVARINSTREGSVWDILDIKLVSAEKDKVVATMPIGPNQRQQVGYLRWRDSHELPHFGFVIPEVVLHRIQHGDAGRDKLQHVLVARDDHHLHAFPFGAAGNCAA